MAIIVLLVTAYVLALSIGCAMILIWDFVMGIVKLIMGIVKLILMISTALVSLFK